MSGVLNLLLAGAASAIKDAYYNLTTLLLNTSSTNGAQNNTFLDSSTNNFSITRNGNTTQGTFTPFSQTGWSNFFNGTTDYLSNSALTTFLFTSDLNTMFATFEAWVYPTSWNGNSGYTHTPLWGNNGTYATIGFYNGTLQFTRGNAQIITATDSISLNTWSHVAVTINQSTVTFYINGVNAGTGTLTGALGSRGTDYIGYQAGGGGYSYFAGYISNFRISTNVAYASNFTPSTTPLTSNANTAVLTCQSNRYIDNSANNYTLTPNGTPSVQAFSPFAPTAAYDTAVVGGSMYQDASGDYLSLATNNTAFQLGAGDWSVEGWVYLISSSASYIASGQTDATTIGGSSFYVGYGGDTCSAFSGGSRIDLSLGTVNKYEWTHIVFCRSGSTVSCFKNGVRQATGTFSGTINNGATNYPPKIGSTAGGTGTEQYLSNVRIVKGSSAYNAASTTITIPTAPLTAIANTQFLLNYTNTGIYDSTAKNVLETVGNAQVSTTQAKWGTTSMYFDGGGDYLVGNSGARTLEFLTGDFTVECWIRFITVGNGQIITADPTTYGIYWQYYSSELQIGRVGVGSIATASWSPSANTWYHVAVTRSGTTVRQFVDGTQLGTNATSAVSLVNGQVKIGSGGAGDFNGYIDDLRITRGLARYVANFSVPTAAFPLQ